MAVVIELLGRHSVAAPELSECGNREMVRGKSLTYRMHLFVLFAGLSPASSSNRVGKSKTYRAPSTAKPIDDSRLTIHDFTIKDRNYGELGRP